MEDLKEIGLTSPPKQDQFIYELRIYQSEEEISREFFLTEELARYEASCMCTFDGKRCEGRTFWISNHILRGQSPGSTVKLCDECWNDNAAIYEWQKKILDDGEFILQYCLEESKEGSDHS